jgi:hypothetical protein
MLETDVAMISLHAVPDSSLQRVPAGRREQLQEGLQLHLPHARSLDQSMWECKVPVACESESASASESFRWRKGLALLG